MHQSASCALAPLRVTEGHLLALSLPGVGHSFYTARGPGICQPQGYSQADDTHAISYQNITTQKILLEKQACWLICQGQEKRRVLDFMHAFLHCLSSQNYMAKSGAIDVNQSFLVKA